MRKRVAEMIPMGVLAAALASAPLAAHAAPAAPAATAAAAPTHAAQAAPAHVGLPAQPNPALAYYPDAARAAGVEGQAVIRCSRNEHLKLVRCSLVSETPTGQGFGAAALAMAAQSPENPKVNMPEMLSEASADQTIKFTLHPPDIEPDVSSMAHTMTGPSIITQPTKAQIDAAYPVRALSDQVRGGAAMICTVSETGHLNACRVADELPAGYGFGQAAVDLAVDFLVKPPQMDGQPVGGRPVRVTVSFNTTDPDAPLSLQTRPAGAKPDPNTDAGGFGAGPAQAPPPFDEPGGHR
jgi:hypothetical protein